MGQLDKRGGQFFSFVCIDALEPDASRLVRIPTLAVADDWVLHEAPVELKFVLACIWLSRTR